jgi:hypothetical protein
MAYFKSSGYSSNFYTGWFDLDSKTDEIKHSVTISSDEKRNGQVLIRKARLQGKELVLSGKNNLNNQVELVWERE